MVAGGPAGGRTAKIHYLPESSESFNDQRTIPRHEKFDATLLAAAAARRKTGETVLPWNNPPTSNAPSPGKRFTRSTPFGISARGSIVAAFLLPVVMAQ